MKFQLQTQIKIQTQILNLPPSPPPPRKQLCLPSTASTPRHCKASSTIASFPSEKAPSPPLSCSFSRFPETDGRDSGGITTLRCSYKGDGRETGGPYWSPESCAPIIEKGAGRSEEETEDIGKRFKVLLNDEQRKL